MHESAVEDAARAAAVRLSETLGQDVAAEVEGELHRAGGTRADRYLDPISLGALIVSVASLAWAIYTDSRKAGQPTPTADVLARTIRVQLNQSVGLAPEPRAAIIEITVEETLRYADNRS